MSRKNYYDDDAWRWLQCFTANCWQVLIGSKLNWICCDWLASWRLWALSIQPKIRKTLKRGQMVRKIPEKVGRKIWKLLNFHEGNYWTENSGYSGRIVKWNGNSQWEISENLGIPRRVVFFSGNSGKYYSIGIDTVEMSVLIGIFHGIDSSLFENCKYIYRYREFHLRSLDPLTEMFRTP